MNNIKEYVIKNCPKRFKNREIIIEDMDNHYRVYHHIDASPLILSKNI